MHFKPFGLSVLATLAISACSDHSDDGGHVGNIELPIDQTELKRLGDEETFYTALRNGLINHHELSNRDDSDIMPASALIAMAEPGAGGNEISSTNIQEPGVDEQDRVKLNDAGTHLFVLHSEYSGYYPPAPTDEPESPDFTGQPESPDFTGQPESPDFTGQPETPDFVEAPEFPDSVVVPESPGAAIDFPVIIDEQQQAVTTLRILALDSETPDATAVDDLVIDLNDKVANGLYLYETDNERSAVITSSGNGFWSYWEQPAAFSELQSVIAKVDVSDVSNASLTETFTIDGQIISSRRIGNSLFFASRYFPVIPGPQTGDPDSIQWREAVQSADIGSLMPTYSRSGSDEKTQLVDASSCFVAPVSASQSYHSPDIITLGVIDLASMKLSDSECFLGATETLYASTESIFLATTQHSSGEGPLTTDGALVDIDVEVFEPAMVWSDSRSSTDIHQFDIQDGQLSYAGSGSVSGHLGWNNLQKPLRMSEYDGYLRVATMNDQQGPDHSPILLHTLQADGQGNLVTVSALPNDTHPSHIGEPGEQLYASRFVGDRAYLATFRQTDPLYVVDWSNPLDPTVAGELEIQGYSDYLHPVNENLLLGIGKDAVPATGDRGDGRGAWEQGMKLSLFDVSDPGAPTELQSVLIGERGTDSVSLRNHRAITIQPATELHPMRVSFGVDVSDESMSTSLPTPDAIADMSQWSYTGLHGFDIVTGANASIVPRGALIVDRADGADRYYAEHGDDRSVMVNDAVFYVHKNNVYPALWDSLDVVPLAR